MLDLDLNLYSIYDRVVGEYFSPSPALRDEVIIRDFMSVCKSHPHGDDFELYKIGYWNPVKGLLTPFEKPEFIVKYKEVNPDE